MVWAIANGSNILQDILEIWFDIYFPSHIDHSTKIAF